MFAGVSWTWWIGFHVAVAALLATDSLLSGRKTSPQQARWMPWIWTAVLPWPRQALAAWIASAEGHVQALEFVAGYAIETSLSIDNLFVFRLSFRASTLGRIASTRPCCGASAEQSCCGALFIALGITLIQRFEMDHLGLRAFSAVCGLCGWYAAAPPMRLCPTGCASCTPPKDRCCR